MALFIDAGAPKDFDFIIGDWKARHRRLNRRFSGCTEWTKFEGLPSTRKALGGFGNLEGNILFFQDDPFRAVAMRSYCTESRTWWLDGRNPRVIDTPVRGKFEEGIGIFFADDLLNGEPIKVRFTWTAIRIGNKLFQEMVVPPGRSIGKWNLAPWQKHEPSLRHGQAQEIEPHYVKRKMGPLREIRRCQDKFD